MSSRYEIDVDVMKGVLEEKVLIGLTDGSGSVDQTILDQAIALAENELDGYAGVYHVTPMQLANGSIHPVAQLTAARLVAWFLLARKPQWLADKSEIGSTINGWRKEILAWMGRISSNNASTRLRVPDAVEKSTPANVDADETWFSAPDPEVTRTNLKGIF